MMPQPKRLLTKPKLRRLLTRRLLKKPKLRRLLKKLKLKRLQTKRLLMIKLKLMLPLPPAEGLKPIQIHQQRIQGIKQKMQVTFLKLNPMLIMRRLQ